ncbi:AEC family transporter [Clostridium tyrobutyricum]|jgi:predicted permease|uniref:AEC family transporter n=1 Tax=Clostridium tyrobutyricum TaxID=1519 RepID=UPI001C389492|nr:AEC family transporter [Clostridium tyrobutyricum]MBV4424943.1 AEC family transporter [Clostridium tyrobutyricum]
MFFTSIGNVLSIAIIIVIGYILAYKRWFNENSSDLIVKIVIKISLPPLLFSIMIENFNREQLISSLKGLTVPLLSIFILYILGFIFSKIMHVNKRREGLFISLFFNSNTIFMGLPVNLALFGQKSVPYVLLYYVANTIFFWTLGVYEISKDGSKIKSRFFSVKTIKKIMSPPLMGYIASIIFILSGIKLPEPLINTCKYLGNISTPLSMIFIGTTIYSVNKSDFNVCREMVGVALGRFIISPVLIFLLCFLIPIPSLMRDVFVIQAAMPVMTNSSIIAKSYNADHSFAAVIITVTTVASIFVIPIYMLILNKI